MSTATAAYATNLKQFKAEVAQAIKAFKVYGRSKMTTDIGAITTALGTDTTKHSREIEAAPVAVRIGNDKSGFSNSVLHAVNKGKASNLTPADMGTALSTALAPVLKPANVDVPHVSGIGTVGQTLTCTLGNWTNEPTSYAYAWQRVGVPIAGATSLNYVLVGADSTKQIGCIVTASNGAGSQAAPISNTILCA